MPGCICPPLKTVLCELSHASLSGTPTVHALGPAPETRKARVPSFPSLGLGFALNSVSSSYFDTAPAPLRVFMLCPVGGVYLHVRVLIG